MAPDPISLWMYQDSIAQAIVELPARARLLDQAYALIARGEDEGVSATVLDKAKDDTERLRIQVVRLDTAAKQAYALAREAGALDGLEGLSGIVDGIITVSAGVALAIVAFFVAPVSVILGIIAGITSLAAALVGSVNLLATELNQPAPALPPGVKDRAQAASEITSSLANVALSALGVFTLVKLIALFTHTPRRAR